MSLDRLAGALSAPARVGLGLAAVGRPGYLNLGRHRDLPADRTVDALRARTHELLDAAYAAGVRYVDTARSYGLAEEFLAEWLRTRPEAADTAVGSKWGYTYTADWAVQAEVHEVKDHTPGTFDRQTAETGRLLGDRLDLYQIHSLTPESPALTDRALHERLAALAERGIAVGFSTSGPRQADTIRAALEVEVAGRPLFTAVQSTYNLLETSAGPALAEAHRAGLVVIVKEALANGRLAGPAAPPALRRIAEQAGEHCDAVALAAVLRRPWVSVVLSGAATTAQLTSNLRAAELTALTGDGERASALGELAEEPSAYWRHRATLPWH